MKRLYYRGLQLGTKAVPVKCSADTCSFDGVIFPEFGAAVADGTAPHVLEANMPLVKDKIIDISPGYENDFAEKYGSVIETTDRMKKELYSKAYLSLGAAGKADLIMKKVLKDLMITDKAERFTDHILKGGLRGKANVKPCACFNCEGFSISLPENISSITVIGDYFGSSELLLATAAEKCKIKGIECIVIPSPVNAESVSALCLGENAYVGGRYFELENVKKVNKKRFIKTDEYKVRKQELMRINKIYQDGINAAVDYMGQARNLHMKIESIYSLRADYSAADRAFVELAQIIFGA
ncbi:MAG: hypothetical protein IJL41_06915 [Clostridia bacterium]|nr:hypothetical protein [Clostridia bacterium]